MTDGERTVHLMQRYGMAKFGDEWWPGNAEPWLGVADGSAMEAFLDAGPDGTEAWHAEAIRWLNRYGKAKFGDEWWPGNAESWLGNTGAELAIRLETPGFGFAGRAAAVRI